MNRTTKIIIWIVVILVVTLVGYKALRSPGLLTQTGPIKIGFIGPLSGDLANIGENAKAAVELAVEEVNASGGINGRQMQVIYEDGKCAGKEATSATNKLISIDKVSAILGEICSSATLAIAPIAEANKTVILSPCSTNPAISHAGDYVFRDVPSDVFQGDFGAKYVYNTLGTKRVAILYINNDWGKGLDEVFNKSFTGLGGTVLAREGYSPDSKDLRSQITKIKSVNPDAVYFAGYTESTIVGLKQAKELGLKLVFFGADAWDDTKIWTDLGKIGEGAMYTVIGTKSSEQFKEKMKQKVGSNDIVYCSNYAYDGIKIFAQALSSVRGDAAKLKDALYAIKYEGGVSNDIIQFDQNGDPVTFNYVVKKIERGKAMEIK